MAAPDRIGGMPVPTQAEIDDAKINTDLVRAGDPDDNHTRAQSAVALRLGGASYTNIAEVLGYTDAFRARQVVERALAESAGSDEDIDKLRYLTARRLERLLQSLWPRGTNPQDPEHLAYARMILATIDRHARVWGVDAPQQMVVHTPNTLELQQWVTTMVKQVTGDEAGEADVIDAEVVEDGSGEP